MARNKFCHSRRTQVLIPVQVAGAYTADDAAACYIKDRLDHHNYAVVPAETLAAVVEELR